MEQKRKIVRFSEEERRKLRELVSKYRDVFQNKKSDAVSGIEKKAKAWEKIAEEFNCSTGQRYQFSSSELKKIWDFLQFKMKQQSGAEKREAMRAGPPEDHELDSLGNLGSYTLTLAGTSRTNYVAVDDTRMSVDDETGAVAVVNEEFEVEVEATIEPDETPQVPQEKGKKSGADDVYQQIIDQERELHLSKMKVEELKSQLLRNRIRNDKELFQLKKENLLLKMKNLEMELEM